MTMTPERRTELISDSENDVRQIARDLRDAQSSSIADLDAALASAAAGLEVVAGQLRLVRY